MRDLSQFLKIRPIRFFHQFVNIKRKFPQFWQQKSKLVVYYDVQGGSSFYTVSLWMKP